MSGIRNFCPATDQRPANAAIFLSGSGSNAEKILERYRGENPGNLNIVALVTDSPKKSRAVELGGIFDIPVISVDIRDFYRDKGLKRISIMTPEGRAVREEWTNELRRQLKPLQVDFGIFAGFVPLCNLAGDFPCLNVHPGDLTYLVDGERYLVGLHTVPIERAILKGLDYLRSSAIIAEPFEGKGENMDAGHILGISTKVMIDLQGHSLGELKSIALSRPDKRPIKGYQDLLEEIAQHNQELLKEGGDWVVFPQVVSDFAAGKYGSDNSGQLHYRAEEGWTSIDTIEVGRNGSTLIR